MFISTRRHGKFIVSSMYPKEGWATRDNKVPKVARQGKAPSVDCEWPEASAVQRGDRHGTARWVTTKLLGKHC